MPPDQCTSCSTPSRIIGRDNAQIFLHLGVPDLRQVLDLQFAFHQGNFQFQAQHDVQVVGGFIRFHADQRRFDFVDAVIELLQADICQLCGKISCRLRVEDISRRAWSARPGFPTCAIATRAPPSKRRWPAGARRLGRHPVRTWHARLRAWC